MYNSPDNMSERQRAMALSWLERLNLNKKNVTDLEWVTGLKSLVESGQVRTLVPLLPLLLNLDGKPYTLEKHFPFEPFFQSKLAAEVTLKTGRQVSKCGYFADEVIRLANGQQVSIQNLKVGDRVLALTGQSYSGEKVTAIWQSGSKPVLRITTRMGACFEVTADHRLLTFGGYLAAGEISKGTRLAGVRSGGSFGKKRVDRARIILTAYMLGDGCCLDSNWTMTKKAGPVMEEFQELASTLEKQGVNYRQRKLADCIALHRDNKLIAWLGEDGLANKLSWQKYLPDWVFELSEKDTALFLSRLWATDGQICRNDTSVAISYSSTSRRLARDVRSLLNKFGIPASIKRVKAGYKKNDVYHACRDAFVVRVETRRGWERFQSLFDVPGKPPIEIPDTVENNNRDTVPIEVNSWIAELASATRWKHSNSLLAAGLRHKPKYALTYGKLARYVRYFESVSPDHPRLRDLQAVLRGDVIWDTVQSVEVAGEKETFDLEVENAHNFVLDGIVSHNSTSIAARGVTMCNAIPNFSLLYVTPLYEQIRRFSTQYVRPFIEQSPVRALWTGTTTENSVLQRSFKNNSKMYFSFACLDADRVRGISAKGGVCVDECVSQMSLIQTDKGDVFVTDIEAGDIVRAYNDDGELVWDVVVKKSYRGRRDCFRIHTTDGRSVTATAEALVATSAGWKHVSELIDAAQPLSETASAGNPPWGRVSVAQEQEAPFLPEQPRLGAARVQPGKMERVTGVRELRTQEAEERRLRGMAKQLRHATVPGVRLLGSPVLPQRQEGSDAGLAGPADLGSSGLVVRGRRKSVGWSDDPVPYRGLHASGSGTSGQLADLAGCSGEYSYLYPEGTQSPLPPGGTADGERLPAEGQDPGVPASLYAVQAEPAGTCRHAELFGLSEILCSTQQPDTLRRQGAGSNAPLWQSGVFQGTQEAAEPEVRSEDPRDHEALAVQPGSSGCRGNAPSQEPKVIRALPPEPGLHACHDARSHGEETSRSCLARSQQQNASREACSKSSTGTDADTDLRALPVSVLSLDTSRSSAEVLPGLPDAGTEGNWQTLRHKGQGSAACEAEGACLSALPEDLPGHDQGRTATGNLLCLLPSGALEGETSAKLCELEIVGFEYVGLDEVYDLETARYHTFFADGVAVHNCQDMDPSHMPIIMETMSAAEKYGIATYTGTPKTLDGTLQGYWEESSQAEWVIPCQNPGCSKENVPAMGHDIERMIGPYHPDISEKRPGTICARCGRPINPRFGRWRHRYEDRRWRSAGYHIPQFLLPLHYANPLKWSKLLAKQQGSGNTTTAMFYNEVLGESYDVGTKLVNLTDLQNAAILPWRNVPQEQITVMSRLRDYVLRILAVDWGGGGEKRVSFTTAAVIGVLPDGKIDVIYGKRLMTPHDHMREASELMDIYRQYQCTLFVHDYTGAGALRETFMIQAGLPVDRVVPVAYVGAAKQNILVFKPASETHPRNYWQLDKTRSLVLTCNCIKLQRIRFFQYDYHDKDNPGLIRDFLALIENKTETNGGGDLYQIIRAVSLSDDFAHSVNLGTCVAFQVRNCWPDLASLAGPKQNYDYLEPENAWND